MCVSWGMCVSNPQCMCCRENRAEVVHKVSIGKGIWEKYFE